MNAWMEPINACSTVTTLLVHTSALVKVVSLLMQMEELVMVSTVDPHPAAETNPYELMCMQTSMSVAMELRAVSKCVITPRDPITASAIMDMN